MSNQQLSTQPKRNLSVPQVRILLELEEIDPLGGISRQRISDRIGYASSVPVYQEIGWVDLAKRAAWEIKVQRKCLLSLGYVRELVIDIEGRTERILQLTEEGRTELQKIKSRSGK